MLKMFKDIQQLVNKGDELTVCVYNDKTTVDGKAQNAAQIANIFEQQCRSLSSKYKVESWDGHYYHLLITSDGFICMPTDEGCYVYDKETLVYVQK